MKLRSNTKIILSVGFTAIVSLMVVLVAISLLSYQSSVKSIETIVNENNLKNKYITQLRTLARERSISMQKMLLLSDPFDRDDEWIRFKEFAGKFIAVRQQLMAMALSKAERREHDKTSVFINEVGGLQDNIVALILDDQEELAHQLLVDEALPKQDNIFDMLSSLLIQLQQEASKSVTDENAAFKKAIITIISIAGCAILASILIAIILVRRTSRIERQLHLEKERAQVTLYSIGDGVITTNSKGEIEHLNTVAYNTTGWSDNKAKGKNLWDVIKIELSEDNNIESQLTEILAGKRNRSINGNQMILGAQNQPLDVEYSLSPIFDNEKNIMGSILIFRDVSEMRTLAKQLQFQAQHDALTKLYNRSEFEKQIEQLLNEVRRYPQQTHWLAYLDIDQFKVINDTCGHLAGDELLKQLSAILDLQVRSTDFIARLGGDEFAIILKHCEQEHALSTIERLHKAIQQNGFCWEDKCFTVTGSIGMVPIAANSGNVYDIMSVVDTACYVAKDEGRNRIHFVNTKDDTSLHRKGEMDWVPRIRSALDENRFVLYHQNIKALNNNSSCFHTEILVRLFDDEGNVVPPNAFIPAAERYNMMTQIDEWIVKHSLDFAAKKYFEDQVISINLSAQSLCDVEFMNFAMNYIVEKNIESSHICFEITETAAIANLSHATRFITNLRSMGCKFALDDFGSGLSSFGYLKNMKVDYLKIDGAFVKNLENDPIDLAMVTSIDQVGKVMGLETIAEFVENDAIEKKLCEIGVDYAQGFGISIPRPLQDLVDEIENNSRIRRTG